MDEKMATALIAAIAALLGSLIPTIVGYLNNRSQQRFEVSKAVLEKQRQAYADLLISLQQMMNTQEATDFVTLQRAVLHVSIFGDDHTSVAVNDYYQALIAQSSSKPLASCDHRRHHAAILNAMRGNLGLKSLEQFELVRFQPPTR